jgi:hypothetical protein
LHSISGAVVRLQDLRETNARVITRLTGGSVVELDPGVFYVYQFNVAGEGKFVLAARRDGGAEDLDTREFDSTDAKQGAHSSRSFLFKVPAA